MNTEQKFYDELKEVPPLPDLLFHQIEKKVNRNKYIIRVLYALAATVILTFGISLYTLKQKPDQVAVQSEISTELQSVREYVNGEDIESEYTQFALISDFDF
jgi:hypothetical protein